MGPFLILYLKICLHFKFKTLEDSLYEKAMENMFFDWKYQADISIKHYHVLLMFRF